MKITKEEAEKTHCVKDKDKKWKKMKHGVMTDIDVMSDSECKVYNDLVSAQRRIEALISWTTDETTLKDLHYTLDHINSAIENLRE